MLFIGISLGIAIARPYFNSTSLMDLNISKAHQSYLYAKNFKSDDPAKFRHLVLLDLELNLSRLQLFRARSTSSMNKHICEQLKDIPKDKNLLFNFARHAKNPETHIQRLQKFIHALEECKQ